jgi:hypothetical protein
MKVGLSRAAVAVALVAVMLAAAGCSKAPSDAQITSDVQNKLSADSGLAGKQLSIQASQGSVTLSGNVDNQAQRDAAARYAAAVPGVKQVVNNLEIQTAQAPAPVLETEPPAPAPPPKTAEKPRQERALRKPLPGKPKPAEVSAPLPVSTAENMGPKTEQDSVIPVHTPPPPPPAPQKVTIPSGTTLAVRLVDTIDTEVNQPGQTFHATLDSPLSADGEVAIPAGYDIEGHIVDVASAGKFTGKSELKLQLDRLAVAGKSYTLQTDQYSREGSSRGKNTAEKVGAGAGIGAIIGGIAGGGKGAAIGAAAGGGLGGGVQAATKGQQIKLPTETVLNFTLQAPLTVVPVKGGPDEGRPRLEPHPENAPAQDHAPPQ